MVSLFSCDDEDDAPQQVLPTLHAENLTVDETNQNVVVTVVAMLSEPFEQSSFVNYSTSDGTAINGMDYTATSGMIEFEPGVVSKEISITIIGDYIKEETESFFLNFTSGIYVSLATRQIEITITDSDLESDQTFPTHGYSTPEQYDGFTRVWQDEFEGSSLSEDWTYEIGTGSNGWGNNELQYYRKENTTVEDGYLIIEARKENFGGRSYTSSRLVTQDKQSFQYGRIDIRALLPQGQGIWPALWMLGEDFNTVGWPACGEIDITEMIGGNGRENEVHGTLHWDHNNTHASYGGSYELSSGIFADEFHVFTIIWDQNNIKWYVDDNHYHTTDITPSTMSEFHDKFFFIFNVAVGGNWPGSPNTATVFPQRMVVDYVRVFQKN